MTIYNNLEYTLYMYLVHIYGANADTCTRQISHTYKYSLHWSRQEIHETTQTMCIAHYSTTGAGLSHVHVYTVPGIWQGIFYSCPYSLCPARPWAKWSLCSLGTPGVVENNVNHSYTLKAYDQSQPTYMYKLYTWVLLLHDALMHLISLPECLLVVLH